MGLYVVLFAAVFLFYTILVVGGATKTGQDVKDSDEGFNPRSLWGERLIRSSTRYPRTKISIHAPRGGSDKLSVGRVQSPTLFQSTLPVGGATGIPKGAAENLHISIHAPRGGSDFCAIKHGVVLRISIHAPRGGSDCCFKVCGRVNGQFQSTLPVGGATWLKMLADALGFISIHAPRGGSDTSRPTTTSQR